MLCAGFANSLAQNVGAVACASCIDLCFKRKYKSGIMIGLSGYFLALLWFMLQLPCFLFDSPVIHNTEGTLVAALILAGCFQGMTEPLLYELGAELTYPVREGMSAGIIVALLNGAAGVMIFVNTMINQDYMNFIMVVVIAVVVVIIGVCVKEKYNRPLNKD